MATEQAKKKTQPQQPKTSLLSQGLIGLTWIILFFFLGSYLITESWTWGYRGKWTNINTYIPVRASIYMFPFSLIEFVV